MKAVPAVLVLLVALIGYNAYRKHSYEPGARTDEALANLVLFVDTLGANEAGELKRKIQDAYEEQDFARIERLLKELAEKAGKVRQLDDRLVEISKGRPPRPAPPVE